MYIELYLVCGVDLFFTVLVNILCDIYAFLLAIVWTWQKQEFNHLVGDLMFLNEKNLYLLYLPNIHMSLYLMDRGDLCSYHTTLIIR